MFETEDFQRQLESAISNEAGRQGLKHYETRIVSHLQNLASTNERVLMERELRKPTGRRGIPDALGSARMLVSEASRYASAAQRDTLQLSDIQRAYEVKFCQLWPFCQ